MLRWMLFQRDRLTYLDLLGKVRLLQGAVRVYLDRVGQVKRHFAALCIQSIFRGYAVRVRVWDRLQAWRVLARFLLRVLAKQRRTKRQWDNLTFAAAACIQAVGRGYIQRRAWFRLRSAAVVLQSLQRGRSARHQLKFKLAFSIGQATSLFFQNYLL